MFYFKFLKYGIQVEVCTTHKNFLKLLDDTSVLLSIFNEGDNFNLEKFLSGKIHNFNINLFND